MADLFGLGREDIDRLKKALKTIETGELLSQRHADTRRFKSPRTTVFGKLTSSLSSIGSPGAATPTTGVLNIYQATSTGGTQVTSPARTVGVYNLTTEAYTTSEWVQASQDQYAKWIVDGKGSGGGSGSMTKIGRPDTAHPTGTFREYSVFKFNSSLDLVDSGNNVTNVYQASGEGYTTDVMHYLIEVDADAHTVYWSFPVELTDCEALSNLGPGTTITPTTTTFQLSPTVTFHTVDTPSTTYTTVDIRSIANGSDGDLAFFRSSNSGRNIVFKDATSTGNLSMSADFTLTHPDDHIGFIYFGGTWSQITQHNNA